MLGWMKALSVVAKTVCSRAVKMVVAKVFVKVE